MPHNSSESRNFELVDRLTEIGIALSSERNLDSLLHRIVLEGRKFTSADAGSLYLVEKGALVFEVAQNETLKKQGKPEGEFDFQLPLSRKSIAGYVAQTGKILNIADAYQMDPDIPFTINRNFDETSGYRSRSMLVVPMQNREGEAIGVLQLINKKKDAGTRLTTQESFENDILPFTALDELLLRSLASQAAISVENNTLYQKIETLFERFVDASVLAIESRDPVTQGHSKRVARMTVELAQVANRTETGA